MPVTWRYMWSVSKIPFVAFSCRMSVWSVATCRGAICENGSSSRMNRAGLRRMMKHSRIRCSPPDSSPIRKPPFQVFPLQPEIAERAFQPQPSGNERMLRKVANLLFGKPSVPFPVDAHRAESRFQRPRQNLHQAAFSASVAPEHSRHAACFDEQVNTRENAPFAERQLCGVDFENMFFSGRYAAGRRNSSAKDSITRNPPRSLRPAVFGGGCRGCGNSRIHRNSAG